MGPAIQIQALLGHAYRTCAYVFSYVHHQIENLFQALGLQRQFRHAGVPIIDA